ncbi:unnamed protein product [Taenia asiatica]|uniref:Secreted protein n=1 Tax=Taenia asiatica TaxID=60517 RepID=A0A0R3VYY0_TAEAS|nr:unnamed protein product [Taenia asiatica]
MKTAYIFATLLLIVFAGWANARPSGEDSLSYGDTYDDGDGDGDGDYDDEEEEDYDVHIFGVGEGEELDDEDYDYGEDLSLYTPRYLTKEELEELSKKE